MESKTVVGGAYCFTASSHQRLSFLQGVFVSSIFKWRSGFVQRDYLHVFVTCGVGATTHSSLLGIAVDLTLIAGFRGQRVIICFSVLFGTNRAATKAQTRNTVPVGPKQSRSSSRNLYGQLSHGWSLPYPCPAR